VRDRSRLPSLRRAGAGGGGEADDLLDPVDDRRLLATACLRWPKGSRLALPPPPPDLRTGRSSGSFLIFLMSELGG